MKKTCVTQGVYPYRNLLSVVTCVSHIMLTDVWALSNEHVLQVVDLYWRSNWALYQICRITATSLDLSSYCYVIKKKRQGTYFHVWHAHFCSYSSIFSLAVDPRTPVPHLISGSPLVPQEATHCARSDKSIALIKPTLWQHWLSNIIKQCKLP